MPTLLGPSNIPPIEALLLGCPILCSDLDGHKEILGDSALYFNPLDDLSVLKCMELITDDFIRNKLLIQQNLLTQITDHTIEKSLIKLQEHFIEAANIRNCWI
jgi:glycosyltransferase involved in cell wall biosynthesis